jgi:hypothetical protein
MKIKITFLAILFTVFSFGQVGTVFTAGGLNYKIATATTVDVVESPRTIGGAIVIPPTVKYNDANYTVTVIGYYAFGGSGITSITIPNTITRIDDGAFMYCTSLSSIEIPNSVTIIGIKAFYNTGIQSLSIGNSVTSIGDFAFELCTNLASVTIPNSVTSIGIKVFRYCSKLTTVSIPNSITSIPFGTFELCTSLTAITIPDTITSIGLDSFSYCKSLTTITIPNSVTDIGAYAFNECYGLTWVGVKWTTPLPIFYKVFYKINLPGITLIVPQGLEAVYKSADVWNSFGTITSTLATNQFSTNTPIKFYPNPSQSQINFSQEINTLEVFDIAGKKVKSFQNPSTNYDVSTLDKGVYILKGKTTDGKSVNEKMVKE